MRLLAHICGIVAVLTLAGCGGNNESAPASSDEPLRAAALSLQQAMDSSARAIDGVRGTRDALDRLRGSIQPAIAQTGDVIVLLTPKATGSGTESLLLSAAREQRSFLQFAADATQTRSRSAANGALQRANAAGRRTISAYAAVTQKSNAVAGSLPNSTTFNMGRLRDAVRRVNQPNTGGSQKKASPPPAPTTSTCGDGVSVDATTSCPFGRNVALEYGRSGGASTIEVYSPVTKEMYTMSCSGGAPTVCRGGNNAVVYIR